MPEVRTTISFREELYTGIKSSYRELGFTRMGDLVNEAVGEYLHRRTLEEKHKSMELAAADASYRELLTDINEEFRPVDPEGLPDY